MQLKDSIHDDNDKKKLWIEFKLNNELLMAYTLAGTFEGELEATLLFLAHDNDCDINDIKYEMVYK